MSDFVFLPIDFVTLDRIIGPIIEMSKPILLRGRHGIGKSEFVYQIAKRLSWNSKLERITFNSHNIDPCLPVIERRASQMTEGDLVGLPIISNNRTMFNPPDWFKQSCEIPTVLFIDEIDRGSPEIRQGFFELTDSRKLNGHILHPGTCIFAAINGGKHSNQYQVSEMDPAELDRWVVFDLEPSVEDWMIWGNTKHSNIANIHPIIVDFINHNRNHLEQVIGDFEPNKKYPSRRSWKRLSDVLNHGDYFSKTYNKDLVVFASSIVGVEAAISLADFIKNMKKLVLPKDIIYDGRHFLTKEFSINEHCALIDKFESQDILKKNLSLQELENLGRYFISLPSEPCVKLFKIIGRCNINENIINFCKLKIDGIPIENFYLSILSEQYLKDKETNK